MSLLSASRRVVGPLTARVAFSNVLPAAVFQLRRNVSQPAYDGHIPLNWAENAFLAVGSAVMSLVDPRRGGVFEINKNCDFMASSFRPRYDRGIRRDHWCLGASSSTRTDA